MGVKLLDRPISSPSRLSIMNHLFGAARFYHQQWRIGQRKTFMSCIKRCSQELPKLLLPSQLMAGRAGARRLLLVIIQSGLVFLIPRSMSHQMARPLASLFTITETIQALMFWLTFTWHS